MGKIRWNDFVELHGNGYFFCSIVYSALASGPHFDRIGKRFPSPYGLFQEWMKKNLKGTWSTTKVKGAFCAATEDDEDARLIVSTFGAHKDVAKIGGLNPQFILYSDSSYGEVARAVGYVL